MAYEFNRKMVLEPKNSTPNFEEVRNLIRELVMKSTSYFPHEKDLEKSLKQSYISADELSKEINLEKVKELEKHWESSMNSFANTGVKLRMVNPSEEMTPENDLIKRINETNEKIKENSNKAKLDLSKDLDEDSKLELEMQKLQAAIANGIDPKIALNEMNAAMQKDNSMKKMPTIGKPGFNVHDRISATLKNKEAQKGFEITSDILLQKNHDLASKCESGYYTPELINGSKGNLLHLAALHNPHALETLVYQGGADINQIRSDWVVGPETKREIERLQYEKNNPIKSALGIKAPQR